MTFVSFAQNAEDVMLWRALAGVESGFYIDVGAQDPELDSVTRAFYDRGWHGVNVEPMAAYRQALEAARPRDITLGVALADQEGRRDLFEIEGTGLSTLDAGVATLQARRGWRVDTVSVAVSTLAAICREHAPADIHFLKIDVEGGELAVLRGADFAAFRPWVVLVEATLPNSQEENWADWEGVLLAADYRFVWFDGLNRFYVAGEHYDRLARHFRAPPNVYDHFVRNDPEARRRHRAALADIDTLRNWNASATRTIATLRQQEAASRDAMPGLDGSDSTSTPPSPSAKAEDPRPSQVLARSHGWSASADHDAEGPTRTITGIGRLRRLLRPLAVKARYFINAETRTELAELRAAIAANARLLAEIREAQEGTSGSLAALAERIPGQPTAEPADLVRAMESALLTLAVAGCQVGSPSPSTAQSRSA